MLVWVADLLSRRAYWIAMLTACAVGIAVVATGSSVSLENWLDQRASALTQKASSGDIIIVEIDAKSLAQVQAWPWPRSIHGRLVDRLREAGARRIAFDIDFTSPASDPAQDRAFGAAIARANGRVVLPAILENSTGEFGERVESLPSPPLRAHAQIGSIWIRIDDDMIARRLPYSVAIGGAQRPSLAAFLAEVPSDRADLFPIDWSFDRSSFPTISYSDVLNGRFDPNLFRNRNVLVGATSTTLGDRFTVPVHGRIPGVFIQATGAETLRLGAPKPVSGGPVAIIVWIAVGIALLYRTNRARLFAMAAAGAAMLVVPALIEKLTPLVIETAPAVMVYFAASLVAAAASAAAAFTSRLTRNSGTLLPNLTAMTLVTPRAATTVAVRVKNHLDTAALLGPQAQAELLRRICDRLSLAAGEARVFQVDEHSFAWRTTRSLDETIETVEGLNALFSGGIVVGDRALDVAVAIGICADEHLDIKTAVSAALLAADRAVRRGIAWGRYEPDDDDEKWRISVLADLGRAIQHGDIWVAYQPQLDLRTARICGAEALVRWTHPTRGPISPIDFIEIAERNGRIGKLTAFVLDRAAAVTRDILRENPDFKMSVNLSPSELGARTIVEVVRSALARYHLPPSSMVLEITETAAIAEGHFALSMLNELRGLGVGISIDDYGTGMSTLEYLRKIPATELKIDRRFTAALLQGPADRAVMVSTIELAHILGLEVVAEGIETPEQLFSLAQIRCDRGQGYHIARPMEDKDLKAMIAYPAQVSATG